jgi:hypothetical protein
VGRRSGEITRDAEFECKGAQLIDGFVWAATAKTSAPGQFRFLFATTTVVDFVAGTPA